MGKRILSVCLLVLFVLFSAGYAAAGGSAEAADGPVELRWSYWGGDARFAKYEEIANRYMAAHPDVKMILEPMSWNDYWTKIPTQVAAGAAPDIMQMHMRYVKMFTDSNSLLDLQPLADSGVLDLSDFTEAGINTGIVEGKNVMVSIGLGTTGVAVNTTVAEKYGIAVPSDDWDWVDFEAYMVAAAAKTPEGIYPIGDLSIGTNNNSTPLTMYLRSRGGDLFSPDGSLGFTEKDLTAWWTMWDKLRKAGAVPPAYFSTEEVSKTWEQTSYVAGEQIFTLLYAGRLRIYQDQMPTFNLEIIRAPNQNGAVGEFLEGAHTAINGKTKYPEAAAAFLSWFVNDEASMEIYKIENGWPASAVMNEFVAPLLNETEQKAAVFMGRVTADEAVKPYVTPPDSNAEIVAEIERQAQAIGFGQKSIDKAVADFFKAAANIID